VLLLGKCKRRTVLAVLRKTFPEAEVTNRWVSLRVGFMKFYEFFLLYVPDLEEEVIRSYISSTADL
jgi:hypothetical protein